MDVTYLEHVALSGPFTPLHLRWSGDPTGSRVPLTFNQRNHLAAALATGRSSWIGGTVGVPDGASAASVAEAVHAVVGGADALRATARDDNQQAFAPEALTVTPAATTPDVPPTAELEALVADRCRPGAVPGLFFALCGPVLLFGVDHFHADMLSVALLQRRLHEALSGGEATETASYLGSAAPVHDEPDRALDVWSHFLDVADNRIPSFPVDLGSGGAPVEPVHDVRHLLDASDLSPGTDLDRRTFAVALTCLAGALEPLSGGEEFATIIPVHTRGRRGDPRHDVVGWMVSNAPVIARAGDVDATARWLRDAVTVAGLPLETMMERLRPTLPGGVIPMVSYMDFRSLGEPLPQARYVSSTSPTDTVQFWFSRTVHGLDLRTKYPDTPEARRVMSEVFGAMDQALRVR